MQITVTEEYNGMQLGQFLRRVLGFSTKMIKHLKFEENGILVNGTHVTVRHTLQSGDRLSLATEDRESAPIEPIDLPLRILYEDADIVVPAKPTNMPTHPSCDHHDDTVANALAFRYRQSATPFVFRPINRLDRNTSGLLLVARNRVAAGKLSAFMRMGRIQKTYLAVLDGELPMGDGQIDAYLHRTAQSIILREVCSADAPDADEAHTLYTVLAVGNGHTLVCARPLTGRTHQLRVHFASIGHPITGDDLYGKVSDRIARHALHAHTLCFPHPATACEQTFTAPLPSDMEALIRTYFPLYISRLSERSPL